jgi:hypothetical protein
MVHGRTVIATAVSSGFLPGHAAANRVGTTAALTATSGDGGIARFKFRQGMVEAMSMVEGGRDDHGKPGQR